MAHILMIDDDELFRDMIVFMLKQEGHEITIAQDGEEGLLLSQKINPDLIITDILMPNMDGIELIMSLNQLDSIKKIPIIAISGGRRSISAEFNLQSASLMGVKATLSKPFNRIDLCIAVEKVLGK